MTHIRPKVIIMVKEPHLGRVKTRLARGMGATAATWWFRHQSKKLIRALSNDGRFDVILAVSPDYEGLMSRVWPATLPRYPQGRGNLGDRMKRIFKNIGQGPMVIIGADIPDITPSLIETAFKKLGTYDAVFGPAPDGGYWLIGLKGGRRAIPLSIFENVRWSSDYALQDTKKSLKNFEIAEIKMLQDVDTIDDLEKIKRQKNKKGRQI